MGWRALNFEPKPKYMVKDAATARPIQVKIHPSSVSRDERKLSSPFLVYQELVKIGSDFLYLRHVTPVPPLALVLFGGSFSREWTDILVVDNWIRLIVPPSIQKALLVIRQRLDDFFDGWVE